MPWLGDHYDIYYLIFILGDLYDYMSLHNMISYNAMQSDAVPWLGDRYYFSLHNMKYLVYQLT